MDLLNLLLEHDRWATDAYLHTSFNLTDDQLDQGFDIGHRTLRATFVHLIDVIDGWTAAMEGRTLGTLEDDHSVASLVDWHTRSYDTFAAFARHVYAEGRQSDILASGNESFTLGTTIAHVILHNQAHRSEALHILRRLDVPNLPEGEPLEWEIDTGRRATVDS